MLKIGVIILNYLAYKTTIDTVNSFLNQNSNGCQIEYVIVDNFSSNDSFEVLKKEYKLHSNIHVVKTDSNLGFARGNNFGYNELIKIINPDFVIVSNDDILLPKEGLYEWIEKAYKKYNFAVLGPDIYSIKGKYHQNPMNNFSTKRAKCKKILKNFYRNYYSLKIRKLLGKKEINVYPSWKNNNYDVFTENKTLHGSFQVFSRKYFEHFNEIYNSDTFLYMEERILKLRCDEKKIKMIYDPSYSVEHLQAVSTNLINPDSMDKEIIRYKNLINSLKVYINLLN